MSSALLAAAAGLGLGLSLIVAIGAQNALVLRQGLRSEHVAAVVAVCLLSDVVLITAGVGGAGALVARAPGVVTVVCFAGAAFLLVYGLLAARRAWRPAALLPDSSGARAGLAATVSTALALTWLNPHVYLDTVVLLGSLASTYDDRRWWFGAGAAVGSAVWFVGLGYGARLLRPVFARPRSWQVLDAGIAVVMVALAASLAVRGATGG
ncbi:MULTISPECIES: LysE/ArgO family amino acid transporter [unclassified Modestobacter]|uniref:LysE/ArgO family amino acid transporter n=1 Tax=unclassified Modestobacter TaxID=2643866 RepID=UPI0022AB3F48|nr:MULTISPECIES: LysE/ArgO family amino acid transporter [unclassified Modestobacter]MCZ2823839.1 LysE/ArgO family amino acid transporter [Modestobacter sp. VKM Ac-2981]MCZ2852084.1 LysE/ArgO family amino acid transporter [Modestobacter sp. VKM Ac-2982]